MFVFRLFEAWEYVQILFDVFWNDNMFFLGKIHFVICYFYVEDIKI